MYGNDSKTWRETMRKAVISTSLEISKSKYHPYS